VPAGAYQHDRVVSRQLERCERAAPGVFVVLGGLALERAVSVRASDDGDDLTRWRRKSRLALGRLSLRESA
jgi:hypothetical protein